MNPETHIPFTVGDSACVGGSQQHNVTLRIYNVLAQLVAVPVVEGSGGQPLNNLALSCGSYIAYWDGKYRGTGREAASGVYVYELIIDGERLVKRMLVAK